MIPPAEIQPGRFGRVGDDRGQRTTESGILQRSPFPSGPATPYGPTCLTGPSGRISLKDPMTEPSSPPGGYWYGDHPESAGGVSVLELLRRYRAAEMAMRASTRSQMRMGETDLAALRFLLAEQRQDRPVTSGALARALGITTASTSTLLTRLERSGHLVRAPHPTDRRSTIIRTTPESEAEVRTTLGTMHARMLAVTDALSPSDAETVRAFLHDMIAAVSPDAAREPGAH